MGTDRRVTGGEVLDLKVAAGGPVCRRYPARSGLRLVFNEKVLLNALQAVACRSLSDGNRTH